MGEHDSDRDRASEAMTPPRGSGDSAAPPVGIPELPRPGDALRSLPAEARQRGTRLVSARAMQARLFSVYDAAAAAEEALALVQEQLTLTLKRSYYEADEIETTAAQLDALLTLPATEARTASREVHDPTVDALFAEDEDDSGVNIDEIRIDEFAFDDLAIDEEGAGSPDDE